MTHEDLIKFNWTGVSFAEQEDKKIIILICSTLVSADNLLNVIKSNAFDLRVIVKAPQRTFSFEIDFQIEDIMRFDSIFTEENYPQVKWVKLQQITHITTAYRDENNKLQLTNYFHPLKGNLYLN